MDSIQGLWIGGSLGLIQQLCIQSYLDHGHPFELYVYGRVQGVPEGAIVREGAGILPKERVFRYKDGFGKGSYAGFANLFRFKLLMERGGIWSDLDVVCLKPMRFDRHYVFSSERDRGGGVKLNNTFMKAIKNSEIMGECYKKSLSIGHEHLEWRMNGSDVLQACIRTLRMEEHVLNPSVICPVDYWRYEDLAKRNQKFYFQENTCAVHLWNHMWERKMQKEGSTAVHDLQRLKPNQGYDSRTMLGSWLNRHLRPQGQRQAAVRHGSDKRGVRT